MSTKTVRLVMGMVLAVAFGGLLYSTLSKQTEYYKHVEEVMANSAPWHNRKLQLHGFASDVRRIPNTLEYRFVVENAGYKVVASYTGIVPDTFKDGAEVVLKGRLTPEGGFHVQANGVMARADAPPIIW